MVVYKLTNLKNGKIYIGLTASILKTRKRIMYEESNRLTQGLLYNAIRKHGKHNFQWSILQKCTTKNEMYKYREHYIKIYNAMDVNFGYNCHSGSVHYKISDTTRGRLCIVNSGKNNPNYGVPMTKERQEAMLKGLRKFKKKYSEKLRQEYSKRTEKKCYRCQTIIPIGNFYKDKSKLNGFANICKDCDRERKVK